MLGWQAHASSVPTMTLTEFLRARFDEDEAWAKADLYAPREPHWRHGREPDDTIRVLAEVEAKRRIVDEAADYSPELSDGDNGEWAFNVVLRALALPYADHPDYRQEWKP